MRISVLTLSAETDYIRNPPLEKEQRVCCGHHESGSQSSVGMRLVAYAHSLFEWRAGARKVSSVDEESNALDCDSVADESERWGMNDWHLPACSEPIDSSQGVQVGLLQSQWRSL